MITALLSDQTATSAVVTIDDYWLQMLLGSLLPWLVQLASRRFAAGAVKAGVLLLLSVVTGFLTALQTSDGSFEVTTAATSVVLTFLVALASHLGIWKPFGITGDGGAIAKAVPGGIGTPEQNPYSGPDTGDGNTGTRLYEGPR